MTAIESKAAFSRPSSSAVAGGRPPRAPTGGTNVIATPMGDDTPEIVVQLLAKGWTRVPIGDNTIIWVPPAMSKCAGTA